MLNFRVRKQEDRIYGPALYKCDYEETNVCSCCYTIDGK